MVFPLQYYVLPILDFTLFPLFRARVCTFSVVGTFLCLSLFLLLHFAGPFFLSCTALFCLYWESWMMGGKLPYQHQRPTRAAAEKATGDDRSKHGSLP